MRTERISIIGVGGHAKVVVDALQLSGWSLDNIAFFQEDLPETTSWFTGRPVNHVDKAGRENGFHVAIGSNSVRRRLTAQLLERGSIAQTVIHPRATVALTASIGEGSFIAAGAVVGPQAVVGCGCIVNHNAVVDHDVQLGSFAHVAPGATLAGGVKVMDDALIGAGANVISGVCIGSRATIGAGAVVLRNVPPQKVMAGVPAQAIRETRT